MAPWRLICTTFEREHAYYKEKTDLTQKFSNSLAFGVLCQNRVIIIGKTGELLMKLISLSCWTSVSEYDTLVLTRTYACGKKIISVGTGVFNWWSHKGW